MIVTNRNRIVGIEAGEVRFDFFRVVEDPYIEVQFALLREDDARCGKYIKTLGWSTKVVAALQALKTALEEDGAKEIFEGPIDLSADTGKVPQI